MFMSNDKSSDNLSGKCIDDYVNDDKVLAGLGCMFPSKDTSLYFIAKNLEKIAKELEKLNNNQ